MRLTFKYTAIRAPTWMPQFILVWRGSTIDQMPLDRLMGSARILDLSGISPAAMIGTGDLGSLKETLTAGDSLIIKTGWSSYAITDPKKYRDQLPRISEELAHWLVEKKIKILAVEPPSIADVNDLAEVTAVHQILFSGQVIIVEGICNLDNINVEEVELMVMPLKIGGETVPPPGCWLGHYIIVNAWKTLRIP